LAAKSWIASARRGPAPAARRPAAAGAGAARRGPGPDEFLVGVDPRSDPFGVVSKALKSWVPEVGGDTIHEAAQRVIEGHLRTVPGGETHRVGRGIDAAVRAPAVDLEPGRAGLALDPPQREPARDRIRAADDGEQQLDGDREGRGSDVARLRDPGAGGEHAEFLEDAQQVRERVLDHRPPRARGREPHRDAPRPARRGPGQEPAEGRQHLGPLAVLGEQEAGAGERIDERPPLRRTAVRHDRLLAEHRDASAQGLLEGPDVRRDRGRDDQQVGPGRRERGVDRVEGLDPVAEPLAERSTRRLAARAIPSDAGDDAQPRFLEEGREEGTEPVAAPPRPDDHAAVLDSHRARG
jgi:hypothetical protein